TRGRRDSRRPSSPGPPERGSRLEGAGEADRLRRHERRADLELDLRVRRQRNPSRIAGPDAPVDDRRDRAVRRADRAAPERLAPDVEELPEHEAPLDRRLDVDQPVVVTRAQRGPAVVRRDAELTVAVVLWPE